MAPTSKRLNYDQALKQLFAHAHEGMLALLLPGALAGRTFPGVDGAKAPG